MSYTITCPFCDEEQDMGRSEFPFTTTGCTCGAGIKCSNREEQIQSITKLPRTEYIISMEATINVPADEAESEEMARIQAAEMLEREPSNTVDFDVKPAVSREKVREVLEAGIHGDGPGISSHRITEDEIRDFGVDLDE